MKTKRTLQALLICVAVIAIIAVSCKKDDNDNPVIEVISPADNQQYFFGDTVFIKVRAYDNDGYITDLNFYINNNNVSIDGNKLIYDYNWLINDNFPPADYTVKIEAIDNEAAITTKEITVTVAESEPVPDFYSNINTSLVGNTVQFTDISKRKTTSWLWDFGDGQQSSLQNPGHKYNTAGKYNVKLTSSNEYGESSVTKNNFITIIDSVLTDIDTNEYKLVVIGKQIWMAENLKTTRYADGSAMIDGTNLVFNTDETENSYYYVYEDNSTYLEEYGRLYNIAAYLNGYNYAESATDKIQGACPDGWHVPSINEWYELINTLGGIEVAGGKLKTKGYDYWLAPNTGATNESGFSAKGGGYGMGADTYKYLKRVAYYGTSSKDYILNLFGDRNNVDELDVPFDLIQFEGISVRCVKD